MKAGESVFHLLEGAFLDSAYWCPANSSLATLALAPAERPSLELTPDRPSFQRLVRDILVLGQRQGSIRKDDDPNFMALILLGIYGQAMLSVLAGRPFTEDEIRRSSVSLLKASVHSSRLRCRGSPKIRPEFIGPDFFEGETCRQNQSHSEFAVSSNGRFVRRQPKSCPQFDR